MLLVQSNFCSFLIILTLFFWDLHCKYKQHMWDKRISVPPESNLTLSSYCYMASKPIVTVCSFKQYTSILTGLHLFTVLKKCNKYLFKCKYNSVLQLYMCIWIMIIEHTVVNNNLILQALISIHIVRAGISSDDTHWCFTCLLYLVSVSRWPRRSQNM